MNTKHLVLGLTLSIYALCVSGCAENRASFFVMGIMATEGDCSATPSEEGPYITQGFLDVLFSSNYIVFPLLSNQLATREDVQSLVVETNGINVEGANVRIWRGGRPQGDTVYSFYQPASCYVGPGDIATCPFIAVPEVAMEQLIRFAFDNRDPETIPVGELVGYEDLITIGIQLLGTTTGNVELETPEFYFTLQACYGCTVRNCTRDSDTGELCPAGTPAQEPSGCLGQGGSTDCCAVYDATTCAPFCGF